MIVESDPSCDTNQTDNANEFDFVEMKCSVNYSGTWAPVMTWQQAVEPIITTGVVRNITTGNHVTSVLTVQLTSKIVNCMFTCTTYFNESDNPLRIPCSAPDTPNYNFTWTSCLVSHSHITEYKDRDGRLSCEYDRI